MTTPDAQDPRLLSEFSLGKIHEALWRDVALIPDKDGFLQAGERLAYGRLLLGHITAQAEIVATVRSAKELALDIARDQARAAAFEEAAQVVLTDCDAGYETKLRLGKAIRALSHQEKRDGQ